MINLNIYVAKPHGLRHQSMMPSQSWNMSIISVLVPKNYFKNRTKVSMPLKLYHSARGSRRGTIAFESICGIYINTTPIGSGNLT